MVTDRFGTEIKIGDTVFCPSKKDSKLTVKATVVAFQQGGDEQYVRVSYLPDPIVDQMNLPGLVGAWRVVKC